MTDHNSPYLTLDDVARLYHRAPRLIEAWSRTDVGRDYLPATLIDGVAHYHEVDVYALRSVLDLLPVGWWLRD
jgi:hypothetical protein